MTRCAHCCGVLPLRNVHVYVDPADGDHGIGVPTITRNGHLRMYTDDQDDAYRRRLSWVYVLCKVRTVVRRPHESVAGERHGGCYQHVVRTDCSSVSGHKCISPKLCVRVASLDRPMGMRGVQISSRRAFHTSDVRRNVFKQHWSKQSIAVSILTSSSLSFAA